MMLTKIAPYSKAIAAGLAAAIAFAIPVVGDGVTLPEWLGIVGAFLGGAGIGYAAPKNQPKPDILGKALRDADPKA